MASLGRGSERKTTGWSLRIGPGAGSGRYAGSPWALVPLSRYILRGQRGTALLFVLLVVIVLAAAIFAFSYASQLDARRAGNFRDGVRAFYLAQAGVVYAMALLADDDNGFDTLLEEWAGGPHELEFDDGRVEVRIQDEERKLNINLLALGDREGEGAYGEIFQRLFDELGISSTFLPYLTDWMDADDEEMTPGSEGAVYEALPLPYPVKNGPMITLCELAAVAGIGDAIFEKLGIGGSEAATRIDENPYLTIHSSEGVNINTAGPAVLAALSAAITEDVAQEILSYRQIHPFEETSDLRDLPVVRDVFGDIQDVITTLSTNFLIVAKGEVNGMTRRIRAHVERLNEEVSIQYWAVE